MWYGIIILVCMVIISVLDYFFAPILAGVAFWEILLGVTVSVVAIIIIDLIFALIVRRFLPSKWFSVDKTSFMAKKKERIFYEKIGIKRWKDKVLELGALSNFRKNKIADPTNNDYVGRYISEANYGIIVHVVDIIFGFLVVFIYPLRVWLYFGFPVAVVNAVLNLLPLMILRYNLPKLHTLYKINKKRQERANVGSEK